MKRDNIPLTIADAQRDMRFGYLGGAPGMLVSALVWLAAGVVALYGAPMQPVVALFVGGMLIHPIGVLLTKALRRPGAHTKGNPLGALALESTIQMLMCLPLVYGAYLLKPEWIFPAMLLVIGGRYLTFQSMYGMRVYWACGAALGVAGYLLTKNGAPMAVAAFTGSAIEFAFAAFIYNMVRKDQRG
jgi:hypothetical protein